MSGQVCAPCRHGSSVAPRQPTYAASMLFQDSFEDAWKHALDNARGAFVPGLTAYCMQCRCITWFSRHDDPMDALTDHLTRQKTQQTLFLAAASRHGNSF